MYLANVKKTDDPAVQYEFALFLLKTMQGIPDDSSDTEMTPARLQAKAKSILQRLSDRSYPFAQYYLVSSPFSCLRYSQPGSWPSAALLVRRPGSLLAHTNYGPRLDPVGIPAPSR